MDLQEEFNPEDVQRRLHTWNRRRVWGFRFLCTSYICIGIALVFMIFLCPEKLFIFGIVLGVHNMFHLAYILWLWKGKKPLLDVAQYIESHRTSREVVESRV